MAKQNPATDPVSAAMSAIESALNLTDEDEAVSAESAPQLVPAKATTATQVLKPSPLPAEASTLLRPGPSPAASAPDSEAKPAIPTTAPANDDRETVGAILQAMNARPASRTPFILALIGSLLWAAVCALYAYVALWPTVPSRPVDFLLRPETPLFLLAALAPIFCMFAFAALSRRLRELRQSARAISQVAVRLAEPETMAGEHMVNLSQAIRRELTSMGDGVERALARAAELETHVRSEVSTLERSYSDNERRIRLLIAEMA
ncbi:MAG TPA: apolipoprotein acyltransferase, partial [Roseiarcus sp.]